MNIFKKLYLGTLIVLLMVLSNKSIASSDNCREEPSVMIELIIKDSTILKNGAIIFRLYNSDINTSHNINTDAVHYKITSSRSKIKLPIKQRLTYGTIDYEYLPQNVYGFKEPFNSRNSLFLFQSGDDIKIILSKKEVNFKGFRSEKYNCAMELAKRHNGTKKQNAEIRKYVLGKDMKSAKSSMVLISDSVFKEKKQFLDGMKSQIGDEVYSIYLADLWGRYNSEVISKICSGTQRSVESNTPLSRKTSLEIIEKFLTKFNHKYLPDTILTKSYHYCDFLFELEYYMEQIHTPILREDQSPTIRRYLSIKQRGHKEVIADKVILINLLKGLPSPTELQVMQKELKKLSHKNLFLATSIELMERRLGVAFEFALPDASGKIVSLADFKGKVLIIDFWYTGCINCAQKHIALKPIINSYDNRKDVEFITVSIDGEKKKQIWLESINSEKYSLKSQTNLLANGKDSEIIKYYNITGYPTLVIISKIGQVVTINPPDPKTHTVQFKNLIHQLAQE